MAKNIVTRKATQWGQLRKIHGYKNYEIAETLGHDQAVVSGWFTGRLMPNDENIKELCELFGEDFEKGKQMFLDDYQPSGKRKTIEPKQQAYYIPNIPEEPQLPFVVDNNEPKQFDNCIDLATFLYGKIDIDIVMLLIKSMDLAMTKFNKDPITALEWSLEDLLAKFNAQNITSRCKPRDILHLFDIFASAGYKFYQEDEDNER
jgi:hypothetical protein